MARSDEPDSGKAQSQWYGDQAQWYPETKAQWLSDDPSDESEPQQPAKAAAGDDGGVDTTRQDPKPSSAVDETNVDPAPARETRNDLPLPTPEADAAEAEQAQETKAEEDPKPAGHGQDGPPPPFVDRPVAKEGPPPPFKRAEEPPAEALAEPEPDFPNEDLVLEKPIVLPPAAHELPPQPAYQAPSQAAYPPPPSYGPPAQAMRQPRLWHRMHTPVGVFLVVFGLGSTANAALRWSDHRTELGNLLSGTVNSLANSAGPLLVGAHVVEVLLVVVAVAGLARRRSVWFLPTILGWMVGFGVFAGLNIWAGNTTRVIEQVAYLGGFTILLFLSYALGVKARVNQQHAAAYADQPLTRTQELALAALSPWQRRQGHPS